MAKRKIKPLLALWHFFTGHPVEMCHDVAPLTKRCECGAEFASLTSMAGKLKRDDQKNTCFTDCVAYILGVDSKTVPFFIESDRWARRAMRYFKLKGYDAKWKPYRAGLMKGEKLYIVHGVSPRSKAKRLSDAKIYHAVIYKGDKPHFDPNSDQRFIRGKPTHVWIIKKLSK